MSDTPKSQFTSVPSVKKADTAALITNGTDAFPPDDYQGMYWTGEGGPAADGMRSPIIEPMYKPGTLHALCVQNNTLSQCVEAMEVNIDGTGHSIELIDDMKEDAQQETIAKDFFAEPYPGKTMVSIRRPLRRDLEESGNGYLEVVRNLLNEVVLLNHLPATNMRLVRLDDAVSVNCTITRGGKELVVSMRTRERRYVQLINGQKTYFKEFGASRDINRKTGEWAIAGTIKPDEKGSEVIHFTGNNEPKTPYGVPRWINQLPSVLGSRKAEEHNLDFFDAGGLPPVLVIVQGGTLGVTVTDELKAHLSGKNTTRAAIVEAISTSGSLDSGGAVNVRVERFGSERQSDAMFQQYDKNCEEHVRTSFRLPPLFIGKAADYNFATAKTAYMVAEAQVFQPERDEFDAIMNNRILKSLGVTNYRFRSLPMTLVDVDNQIKAIELGMTNKMVKGEGAIKALNEITGLALEFEEPPEPPAPTVIAAPNGTNALQGSNPGGATLPQAGKAKTLPTEPEVDPKKKEPPVTKDEVVQLAAMYPHALGLHGLSSLTDAAADAVIRKVESLSDEDRVMFDSLVALATTAVAEFDHDTVAEICACATATMTTRH